jgi:hypothetical protein
MRIILALIFTLSAISTVFADDTLPLGKSKIVLINALLQRAGAQKDQQVHLLGTDISGRICEVFVAGRVLGWAFDKSQSGTPQYSD